MISRNVPWRKWSLWVKKKKRELWKRKNEIAWGQKIENLMARKEVGGFGKMGSWESECEAKWEHNGLGQWGMPLVRNEMGRWFSCFKLGWREIREISNGWWIRDREDWLSGVAWTNSDPNLSLFLTLYPSFRAISLQKKKLSVIFF